MHALRRSVAASWSLGLLALSVVAGSASCGPPAGPSGPVQCGGVERVQLDCSSEVKYQGVSGEAGIEVLDIVGAKGSFEEKAIRRVNDQIQEYLAMQTRACRDYNACVLDAEQYRAEAADIRKRIMLLPTLTEALRTAKSESERLRVLDQLYRGVVPEEKREEELSLQLALGAEIPPELGGGQFSLAPGSIVPTGARLRFSVDVSRDAYVYMFQTTPKGEISVLFPNPAIGTSNPVRGGTVVEIPPPGGSFKVNDKDIGTEHVYVVASRKPVEDLNVALDKVNAGQVTTLKDDRTISALARIAPEKPTDPCSRTRGIEIEKSAPAPNDCRGMEYVPEPGSRRRGAPPAGLSVRTSPGDDMIVQVFPLQHVTEAEFKKQGAAKGMRTRGIVVEE